MKSLAYNSSVEITRLDYLMAKENRWRSADGTPCINISLQM